MHAYIIQRTTQRAIVVGAAVALLVVPNSQRVLAAGPQPPVCKIAPQAGACTTALLHDGFTPIGQSFGGAVVDSEYGDQAQAIKGHPSQVALLDSISVQLYTAPVSSTSDLTVSVLASAPEDYDDGVQGNVAVVPDSAHVLETFTVAVAPHQKPFTLTMQSDKKPALEPGQIYWVALSVPAGAGRVYWNMDDYDPSRSADVARTWYGGDWAASTISSAGFHLRVTGSHWAPPRAAP